MKNGAEVRSLDELKENFDLESVLTYYVSGQLIAWLKNYNYDKTTADTITKVEALDKNAPDISKQLCEVLGVEYVESEDVDLDEAKEKLEREKILKQLLTEEQMKFVATNDDELDELLENGAKKVYLAFGSFGLSEYYRGLRREYVILKETNPNIVYIKGNLDWLKKYADQGIAAAQYEIGKFYVDEFCYKFLSMPENDKEDMAFEAIKWFEVSSKQGDYDATEMLMYLYEMLGFMYRLGLNVEKNTSSSQTFHSKACEYALKLFEMWSDISCDNDFVFNGRLYHQEDVVQHHLMSYLADYYKYGYGSRIDKEEAEKWSKKDEKELERLRKYESIYCKYTPQIVDIRRIYKLENPVIRLFQNHAIGIIKAYHKGRTDITQLQAAFSILASVGKLFRNPDTGYEHRFKDYYWLNKKDHLENIDGDYREIEKMERYQIISYGNTYVKVKPSECDTIDFKIL